MRKKQLELQNSALFAEVERKTREMEGLNLKVEELMEKVQSLTDQNDALKQRLEEELAANNELAEKNEQLQSELLEIKTKCTAEAEPEVTAPVVDTQSAECAPLPKNTEEAQPVNDTLSKASEEPTAELEQTENIAVAQAPKPEGTQKPTPLDAVLRDYGAQLIGRVTRITAEVISRVQQAGGDAAESLQTLALGKNESFKFQIMSLAQSGRPKEDIRREMDALATETIAYLESI